MLPCFVLTSHVLPFSDYSCLFYTQFWYLLTQFCYLLTHSYNHLFYLQSCYLHLCHPRLCYRDMVTLACVSLSCVTPTCVTFICVSHMCLIFIWVGLGHNLPRHNPPGTKFLKIQDLVLEYYALLPICYHLICISSLFVLPSCV